MADKPLPCPTVLRLLLRYEPETGKLYWRPRPRVWFKTESSFHGWNAKLPGTEALCTPSTDHGYLAGVVRMRRRYAHRVAWAITHGAWPVGEVDHINGVVSDNRACNLRCVDKRTNQMNASLRKDNTSGCVGVHCTPRGWAARIHIKGRSITLGRFETKEAAIMARKAAEKEHGFHANHGRAKA